MSDERPATPARPGKGFRSMLPRLLRALRRRGEVDPQVEDAVRLPPMSRRMQAFSMVLFFLMGAILTAFLVGNPLGVSELPGRQPAGASGGEERALEAGRDGEIYRCSMHPEVLQTKPGNCPICGMKLTPSRGEAVGEPAGEGAGRDREILYWYAPMDPTYVRDEPGLSPMGMKLVPKYADEGEVGRPGTIRIDPIQVQNIGVVSTLSRREDISRSSKTVGILDFNADNITWVNTKFEGWIEKVHVNYVGQDVRKGQSLFEIYSPELVTTQEEYLRALDYRESLKNSDRVETRRQAESLLGSTRDRLIYWDISGEQIRRLEETRRVERRLTILSPVDGVVAQVMDEALEGMFVRPGMDLYKLADLSTIWVHADIYESDFPWIEVGQPAVVSFRHDPGRVHRGSILFLYPEVSRETRTLKICVEVPNTDRRLRPGMYADVVIQGPPIHDAVVIPLSSVIRSGEREIVFVDLGEGRFEPREIRLGVRGTGERVQVLDGIDPGEAVVTQAQFMLDSESRIQEAIGKFRKRGLTDKGAGSGPTH